MAQFNYVIGVLLTIMLSAWSQSALALDSYRYLHVTIETPWSIFLFLLIGIFAPFVLMAILVWRYSTRYKSDEVSVESEQDSGQQ
ncbi:MAG: hypothetical protein B7X47_02140 [Ferrovum sp. 34-44-207]|jgi:hypothetical protein|uniref:hypothetical protein n=1 Tax=Ferrovum sp. JA12 TaxID=1356299 RepID=UPI000702ED57|nr:hypothetical protein [Ferrovum sp. JA12]KRH79185.1 hypothetical protein FERRO_02480 [Ferrovum sp. JA12]OYV80475.1 MAG: hypothetical protein B7Z65_01100 [Ferrovum sp. 21-44-67]OZB34176.1 MAG: hypothetical protein B7X47_02140 [Ferrovum sp. 34-44-207]HQU06094.1 hypothetical protein [Ferrovaceae bacterium]